MRRAALALLIACTLAVPAAASASQALEAGIADDRLLLGDPDRAAAAVADWSAAGVDVVRIHARWSAIAPDRDATVPPREFHPADPDEPRYDWAALDRAVRLVRAGGLQVMLAITGPGPVWSSSDPTRHDGRYKPSPSHFRAFATAVATRYGAEVDRYLIWNEPNQPLWLTPQRSGGRPLSPHLYRDLVNAAVPAVHAADPGSEVVIGRSPRAARTAAPPTRRCARSRSCAPWPASTLATARCAAGTARASGRRRPTASRCTRTASASRPTRTRGRATTRRSATCTASRPSSTASPTPAGCA